MTIRSYAYVALTLVTLLTSHVCHAEPMVGAYYYPWYGGFAGGHDVRQSLRGHLLPQQLPDLGVYNSRDSAIISDHIDQSHQANIDFWAASWWGPSSAEETTIRTSILAHPRAAELQYAIHYESTGRLGTFENPDFSNLVPDFSYLAANYFDNPNYLHVDGRPIVFMYLTRAYFNSQTARDAVADLRSTMLAEYAVDPYIVGDDLFNGGVDLQRAQLWDAITDFDVYGTSLRSLGSTSAALSHLAGVYDNALAAIAGHDLGFIPTASPGFNDKGVRDGNPAAPRYMTDDPNSYDGDVFARMLNEVVVPRVDPMANNILMINSFNEWHEDTQIERSITAPPTNVDDSGAQQYTEGYFYEGYGDEYLNILKMATEPEPTLQGDVSGDGDVDLGDFTLWADAFGNSGTGLPADLSGDGEVDIGDFTIWADNFGNMASVADDLNSVGVVPEPSTIILAGIGVITFIGITWQRRRTVERDAKRR